MIVKYRYEREASAGMPSLHQVLTVNAFGSNTQGSSGVQSLALEAEAELLAVSGGESKTVQLWAIGEPRGGGRQRPETCQEGGCDTNNAPGGEDRDVSGQAEGGESGKGREKDSQVET